MKTAKTDTSTWHVLPLGDGFAHEDVGEECPCRVRVEILSKDGVEIGRIVTHAYQCEVPPEPDPKDIPEPSSLSEEVETEL